MCTKPPRGHLPWNSYEETDCFGSLGELSQTSSGGVAVQSKSELVSFAMRVVDYLVRSQISRLVFLSTSAGVADDFHMAIPRVGRETFLSFDEFRSETIAS